MTIDDLESKRVWVIKGKVPDTNIVEVYGTGTYIGRKPVNLDSDENPLVLNNPYIELDDDRGHVWGYMCWWTGSEERYFQSIKGCEVKLVDPPANLPGVYDDQSMAL